MKAFATTVVAAMAYSASAFAPASTTQGSTTALSAMPERAWNSMVVKTERSKSVPFLPRAVALDGSLAGDQGFDPFYLSSIPLDLSGFLQPPSWEAKSGSLPTIYWMRESELKHCRIAMLAVLGWLATDGALGIPLRFPLPDFSVSAIPTSYVAHDSLVAQGAMTVMLLACGFVEITTGAVLVQVSKGEVPDRKAGEFGFDPLGLMKGKSKEEYAVMETKELSNGRLAMLAFGGIATQTALGFPEPPYF